MLYFSGFSLKAEEELFENILFKSDYNIAGFSYGAIKAFEYTLSSAKRVDRLQLISPAFFHDKSKQFIRTQLLYFKKNKEKYIDNFIKNCAYPSSIDLTKYLTDGTYEELDKLLNYKWSEEKLQELNDKNIEIYVYLGKKDKIINSQKAYDFFKQYATIYYFNEKGHILK